MYDQGHLTLLPGSHLLNGYADFFTLTQPQNTELNNPIVVPGPGSIWGAYMTFTVATSFGAFLPTFGFLINGAQVGTMQIPNTIPVNTSRWFPMVLDYNKTGEFKAGDILKLKINLSQGGGGTGSAVIQIVARLQAGK